MGKRGGGGETKREGKEKTALVRYHIKDRHRKFTVLDRSWGETPPQVVHFTEIPPESREKKQQAGKAKNKMFPQADLSLSIMADSTFEARGLVFSLMSMWKATLMQDSLVINYRNGRIHIFKHISFVSLVKLNNQYAMSTE